MKLSTCEIVQITKVIVVAKGGDPEGRKLTATWGGGMGGRRWQR